MTPKFAGKVTGGKIFLDDQDVYEVWLGSLENKRIELIVQKERLSRSVQQNKYLFGIVYKLISDELGYTVDEVHSLMKSLFLKDHLEAKGKRYTVIKSTSSLSTIEFSAYIEEIKRWCAKELSLVIPDAKKFEI